MKFQIQSQNPTSYTVAKVTKLRKFTPSNTMTTTVKKNTIKGLTFSCNQT